MNRILTTVPLLAFSLCVAADTIPESAARDIAAKFFYKANGTMRAKADDSAIKLVKSSTGYYAFNRGSDAGFAIVAKDDKAASEILGYADEGTICADSMPENLRWWLTEYDRQMAYIAKNTTKATTSTTSTTTTRASVTPLVTSKWDQGSPYYDKCPTYKNEACYVGCTATAMAQIMYYHKWPAQGKGTISYDWEVNGTKYKTLTADLSQSTYNWDAMTDTYNSASSDESKEAVALLMRDAGYSASMAYSPDGSGAYTLDAACGYVNNFDYDKSIQYVMRDYYTHDEWDNMIYNELASARPVQYSGYSYDNQSGHSFVIDGYNNGYYHANFGWSGVGDGYFLLSAIAPSIIGTGGGSGGYNYSQEAIIGIQKNKGTSSATPNMLCLSEFSAASSSVKRTATAKFNGYFFNYGVESLNVYLGIKVVSTTGTTTYIKASEYGDIDTWYGSETMSVRMSNFPTTSGTYYVYPAFYDNSTSTWYDIPTSVTTNRYLIATVSGSTITFSKPSSTSTTSLAVTDLKVEGKMYAGKTFNGTATFSTSGGDYYGNVRFGFLSSATATKASTYDNTNYTLVDMSDGDSQELGLTSTAPTKAGNYILVVIDEDGNILSDTIMVSVNSVPTSTLAFTAKGISMAKTTDVDPNNIEITFNVKCTGGLYNNQLFYAFFFADGDDTSYDYITSSNVSLAEGDEAAIVLTGAFTNSLPSTKYTAYICYENGSSISYIAPYSYSSITFTTASASGIENVDGALTMQDIRIYSLSGTLVDTQKATSADLSQLPKGVYIVKTGKNTKIVRN